MRSPSVRPFAKKLGISVETASLVPSCSTSPLSRESLSGQLANICRAHSVRAPGYSESDAGAQKASEEAPAETGRDLIAPDESSIVEIGMDARTPGKRSAAEESRIQVAAQDDARKMLESATQENCGCSKAARANSRLTRRIWRSDWRRNRFTLTQPPIAPLCVYLRDS